MKKSILFASIITLTASMAHSYERNQYTLALGFQASNSSLSLDVTHHASNTSDSESFESSNVYGLTLKAGTSFGQFRQHALYYYGQAGAFSSLGDDLIVSINGVGYSYFFNPHGSGFYAETAAGLGRVSDGIGEDLGFGLMVGAGYEISRNAQAALYFSRVRTSEEYYILGTPLEINFNVNQVGIKAEFKI